MAENRELQRAIHEQKEGNKQLERRNALLYKEIEDLKNGHDAIEERARNELGLIKSNEVFFRMHQPLEAHE